MHPPHPISSSLVVALLASVLLASPFLACDRRSDALPPHIDPSTLHEPGDPDATALRRRFLYMSQEGLFPKRLTVRDADALATQMELIGTHTAQHESEETLRRDVERLDALARSLTGMSWAEIMKIRTSW